jgi:hypothetical protein
MQIKRDFTGSTDMWPTSAGGQLIKVANLTGLTVYKCLRAEILFLFCHHVASHSHSCWYVCHVAGITKNRLPFKLQMPVNHPEESIHVYG